MSEMSPLGGLLMTIMRKALFGAGALLLLFIGLLLYQRWTPDGLVLLRPDYVVIGIMVFMLLMVLYLIRGIQKEMKNPGGDTPSGGA